MNQQFTPAHLTKDPKAKLIKRLSQEVPPKNPNLIEFNNEAITLRVHPKNLRIDAPQQTLQNETQDPQGLPGQSPTKRLPKPKPKIQLLGHAAYQGHFLKINQRQKVLQFF